MQVEGQQSHPVRGISWAVFLQKTALALACLLLASAGISWLAANWEHASAFQKLAGTQVVLVLLVFLAWRQSGALRPSAIRDFSPFALLTALAAVTVGGLLALVGQIYQTGADPWQLFLLWAVLILPWLLAARTVFLGMLFALLLNLAAALYLNMLDGRFWFGATPHWASAGLLLALMNAVLLALWERAGALLDDPWRIGPRALAAAMAGWLIVAAMAGFDMQNGPAAPAAIGLMAMALMYRVYTAWRPDLAMVSLAAATAFFLLAIPLLSWVESEASLLLAIVALLVLAGLALRQLGKLIRAARPSDSAEPAQDAAPGLDPWYVSLFRLAVMGLSAILIIVFLFMTLDLELEQLWLAGLVVCGLGLLALRGGGSVIRELGMTLTATGLIMAGSGLYALDDVGALPRTAGTLLLGIIVYGWAAGAALRFLCAFFVLALACLLTWPGPEYEALNALFDKGSIWQHVPAYLRLWWLAVAGVLAFAAARRIDRRAFWLPLAWALACLAQAMAWIAPAPTMLGLALVWQQAPGLLLIWAGCALLPVLSLWALLRRAAGLPRWLGVAAPAALAVASLGWMGAPGVSMALLWLVLGYALAQRSLMVFGVLALLTYLSRFYYQMDATLMQKSLVLGLTGAWLLLSWWALRTKAAVSAAAHAHADSGPRPAVGVLLAPRTGRRRIVAGLGVGLAAVLLLANGGIYQREQILAHGQPVILALAPVDPRSLMQGDYMALRFAAADEARRMLAQAPPQTAQAVEARQGGWLVLRPDAEGVHHVQAVSPSLDALDGAVPEESDVWLEFRLRHGTLRIVTDAWFFPEGQASRYEAARYGEFRVDRRGTGLLLRLLDAQGRPLP
ncbi:GDYXXLXY domain-containing protein [Pusillimonas sp. SM2304]|uniref:GDYXXLXY domain-containing protein n=1 Tax=Pusillimonas sp. SM2304 TaxID=3073241 RepID=UPI0028748DF2|nr:GDYXXLXY domain-containing protein [Pusillimonas sp. SM2304]MDS1139832.1 GDYXXLXY domain-containing protein [Pusillimonas sp. SM2304]